MKLRREKEKMDDLVKYNHYEDGLSDGFEKVTINNIMKIRKKKQTK